MAKTDIFSFSRLHRVTIVFLRYFPWPIQVSAPAIIEYKTPTIVRADAAGFVKAVHVVAGQSVKQGDLLVELENRELETRLRGLELDREKSMIRSRSLHQNREIAAYQSEYASRQSIEKQTSELRPPRPRMLTFV